MSQRGFVPSVNSSTNVSEAYWFQIWAHSPELTKHQVLEMFMEIYFEKSSTSPSLSRSFVCAVAAVEQQQTQRLSSVQQHVALLLEYLRKAQICLQSRMIQRAEILNHSVFTSIFMSTKELIEITFFKSAYSKKWEQTSFKQSMLYSLIHQNSNQNYKLYFCMVSSPFVFCKQAV